MCWIVESKQEAERLVRKLFKIAAGWDATCVIRAQDGTRWVAIATDKDDCHDELVTEAGHRPNNVRVSEP
jgi:hypothetical protein